MLNTALVFGMAHSRDGTVGELMPAYYSIVLLTVPSWVLCVWAFRMAMEIRKQHLYPPVGITHFFKMDPLSGANADAYVAMYLIMSITFYLMPLVLCLFLNATIVLG